MKRAFFLLCAMAAVSCGKAEEEKKAQPEPKILPQPLALDGLSPLKLVSSDTNCDAQKEFVSWFLGRYAQGYSPALTSCLHPLNGEGPLPSEFDSLTPKCKNADWCSYATFKVEGPKNFDLLVSLGRSGDIRSAIVVTSSSSPFQMLFPGKAETKSYCDYNGKNAGSSEIPLMFVTLMEAIDKNIVQ